MGINNGNIIAYFTDYIAEKKKNLILSQDFKTVFFVTKFSK